MNKLPKKRELTKEEQEALDELTTLIIKKGRTVRVRDPRIMRMRREGVDITAEVKKRAREKGYDVQAVPSSVSTGKTEYKIIVKKISPVSNEAERAEKKEKTRRNGKKQKAEKKEKSNPEEKKKKYTSFYEGVDEAIKKGNLYKLNEYKGKILFDLSRPGLSREEKEELKKQLDKIENAFVELGAPSLSYAERKRVEQEKKEEEKRRIKQELSKFDTKKLLTISKRGKPEYAAIASEILTERAEEYYSSEKKQEEAEQVKYEETRFEEREGKKAKAMDVMELYGLSAEQLLRDFDREVYETRKALRTARSKQEKERLMKKLQLLENERRQVAKQANIYPKPIQAAHLRGAPLPFLSRLFRRFEKRQEKQVARQAKTDFVTEELERKALEQEKNARIRQMVEKLRRIREERKRLKKLRNKYR